MPNNFLSELTNGDIYFKYAKGDSSRNGKEFHLFHEIILFLGGNAELISETVNTKLMPNTLVFIPKESYHQVKITGDTNAYLRCIINFSDADVLEKSKLFDRIAIYDFGTNMKYLFDTLILLAQQNDRSLSSALLDSVLKVILYEFSFQNNISSINTKLTDITLQAIRFIEENLTNELSVEVIASACHVSPSTLSHLFKAEMQTSVWRYCLQKKLLAAHDKIASGVPATVAAIECGFSDYSGFYKQYKKMFGFSPSTKQRLRHIRQ